MTSKSAGMLTEEVLASAHEPMMCMYVFQDAAGCMRMFMWHKDPKSVCHCLIALLQKAQT